MPLAAAGRNAYTEHVSGVIQRVFFNARRLRSGWRLVLFFALFAALTGISRFPLVALGLTSWFLVRFVDRRPGASLGLALEPAAWRQTLGGLALGAGSLLTLVGTFAWLGMRLEPSTAPGVDFFVIQGVSHAGIAFFEELLVRSYPFQTLIEGLGTWPAWALSSLGFGLLHLGNPDLTPLGVVNLVLAGLLFALFVLRTRALWLAVGFHFAWNLTQGPILGLPVSGIRFESTLMRSVPAGPAWWTGGAFGPEGGVAATLVLLALILWAWRTPRLRPGPRAYRLWRRGVIPAGSPARGGL